jgi:TolB protein
MARFWFWFILRLSTGFVVVSSVLTGLAIPLGSLLPAGSKLAFMSPMGENIDIYVMDVSRSLVGRVTWSNDWERFPTWSPDGRYLAYHAGQSRQSECSVGYEIYISTVDGREVRQLTSAEIMDGYRQASGYPQCNAMPDWSADGQRITFHSNYANFSGNWDVFSVKVDGTNVQRLTALSGDEVLPELSPDGSKIVYTSGTGAYMFITVMDADGKNRKRLTRLEDIVLPDGTIGTPPAQSDWHPSWSPDGSRIVFTSDRGGSTDIFIMNSDGTDITQLTSDYHRDYEPIWASNQEIIFVSTRDGSAQIYMMDDQGRNLRRLTRMREGASAPSWLP